MPASIDAAGAQGVEFKLWKGMGRGARMVLVAAVLLVGMLCQVLIRWWVGLPLVLFGVLMSLCKGVTNRSTLRRAGRWENVTIDELRRVDDLCRKTAKWARDPFGLTSGVGRGVFLLLAAVVGGGVLYFRYHGDTNMHYLLLADGGIMLLLFFGTGNRLGWQPKDIMLKIEPLLNVCEYFEHNPDPTIALRPMLQLRGKGAKRTPHDGRMMLKFSAAPKAFHGIQVQTSLNRVQGKPYPYMYCVLLAEPGSGLGAKVEPLFAQPIGKLGFFAKASDKKNPDLHTRRYRREVVNIEVQSDVELVVIRQMTLGAGYHTTKGDQIRVLQAAMSLAKSAWGL